MNDDVIIEQGVANEFKSNMQKTYDYLTDCNSSVDNCKILADLGFDGGNNQAYASAINTTKGEITTLLSQVMNCEEDMINLDEKGSERLSTVFENEETPQQEETPPVVESPTTPNDESSSTGENNTGGNDSGGNRSGSSGSYSAPPVVTTTPETPQEETETTFYKFSTDHDTAYNLGDIFIDDYDNSLTKFTNDLLEKYNIKDENVAKKIYEEVINYGKDYYSKNNSNPIKDGKLEDIMDDLYEKLGYLVNDSTKDTFWDLLKNVTL